MLVADFEWDVNLILARSPPIVHSSSRPVMMRVHTLAYNLSLGSELSGLTWSSPYG